MVSDTADTVDTFPYVFTKHPSLIGIAIGLFLAALMIWLCVLWMQHQAYVELSDCLLHERINRQSGLTDPEFSYDDALMDMSTLDAGQGGLA